MAEISIIDDEMMNKMMVRVATKLGHEAASAHTLEDGLGLVRRGGYEVLSAD